MAQYKLTVDFPSLPKGEEVEVPPFGRIPNGESRDVELEDEQVEPFKAAFGLKLEKSRKTAAKEGGED